MDNINETSETHDCEICSEEIMEIEIRTRKSGWFYIEEDIRFCPYCGRKLI
jgi:predicted  nucleic acid-binding Zn-ribbon protein